MSSGRIQAQLRTRCVSLNSKCAIREMARLVDRFWVAAVGMHARAETHSAIADITNHWLKRNDKISD